MSKSTLSPQHSAWHGVGLLFYCYGEGWPCSLVCGSWTERPGQGLWDGCELESPGLPQSSEGQSRSGVGGCACAQYLGEVAVGPGAAAEAPLVTQAVVDRRLHHVARVDLAGADVVLIRQAAEQVLGVTHELGAGGRGSAVGASPLHRAAGACLPGLGCSLTLTGGGPERSLEAAKGLPRLGLVNFPQGLPESFWSLQPREQGTKSLCERLQESNLNPNPRESPKKKLWGGRAPREALGGGATYHVDKSRHEHQGDGEHSDQGAVHLGPHNLPGEGLQRGREELHQGKRRERETGQSSVRTRQTAIEELGDPSSPLPLSLAGKTQRAFLNTLLVCKGAMAHATECAAGQQ